MIQFTLMDLLHSKKTQLLSEFDWGNDLSAQQIEKLAEFFKPYSIPAGIQILTEGDGNDYFCLLCDGKVTINKEDNGGKRRELQTLGPGKLFGEMSFFDRGPCSASVVTKDEAMVLLMDKQSFAALSAEVPQVALQVTLSIISSISKRLRQTTGKLIDFL